MKRSSPRPFETRLVGRVRAQGMWRRDVGEPGDPLDKRSETAWQRRVRRVGVDRAAANDIIADRRGKGRLRVGPRSADRDGQAVGGALYEPESL